MTERKAEIGGVTAGSDAALSGKHVNRNAKEIVRHITRLDRENHELLYAYAQFLGEPAEYVLNQLIETVLGKKDKEFLAWRAEHPQSFVPAPTPVANTGKRAGSQQPRPISAVRTGVSAPA